MTQPRVTGGESAFKSKAARDGSHSLSEGENSGNPVVGPGTYDPQDRRDGRPISLAPRISEHGMGSSAFRDTTLRDPFPD